MQPALLDTAGGGHGVFFHVANNQLTGFEIQGATGHLKTLWSDFVDNVFLQPLELAGEVLIHVRTEANKPIVVITAMHPDDPLNLYWETRLLPSPGSKK